MKDRKIFCLNNIAKIGTDGFRSGYTLIDSIDEAAGVLVRSADMKEMSFPAGLRAIARAGAGVNNIPLDRCAEEGIVVFNTPGANANSVKELVLCGMFLASRDIAGGINWVRENADDENIAKTTEKAKKAFAGTELKGKTLGVIGLGAIGVLVANAAISLGMKVYGFDPYLSVNSAWNLSPHGHPCGEDRRSLRCQRLYHHPRACHRKHKGHDQCRRHRPDEERRRPAELRPGYAGG